jgi:hypothetical protein
LGTRIRIPVSRGGLSLPLPEGVRFGYMDHAGRHMDHTGCHHMDHTGCHQLVSSTIRPTRVAATPGCRIGYVDHTGCHQLVVKVPTLPVRYECGFLFLRFSPSTPSTSPSPSSPSSSRVGALTPVVAASVAAVARVALASSCAATPAGLTRPPPGPFAGGGFFLSCAPLGGDLVFFFAPPSVPPSHPPRPPAVVVVVAMRRLLPLLSLCTVLRRLSWGAPAARRAVHDPPADIALARLDNVRRIGAAAAAG